MAKEDPSTAGRTIAISDVPDLYTEIVDDVISVDGVKIPLHVLDKGGITGRAAILATIFSPRTLKLQSVIKPNDRVLLVGWCALPILALIRLGWIPKPKRVVIMGIFVHSERVLKILVRIWKWLKVDGRGFIANSPGERRILIEEAEVAPEDVYEIVWRQSLGGVIDEAGKPTGQYVFSGGYSNRDYPLLIEAMERSPAQLRIIAAAGNGPLVGREGHVFIERDVNEDRFETVLAGSAVAVLPLKQGGQACGQMVLLRVLRSGKPLIMTEHDAVTSYLGKDYEGLVPPHDSQALSRTIQRCLTDRDFRDRLSQRVSSAWIRLQALPSPGLEIRSFMERDTKSAAALAP
jgi:glycosyltransferase involved in cell wall biosynthesis